nr:hypothetical protein [Streptomyces sp. Alain-F2R5]
MYSPPPDPDTERRMLTHHARAATALHVQVETGGEFWGWAGRTLGAPARTADGQPAWLRLVSTPQDKASGKLWDGALDAQHAFGDLDGHGPRSWPSTTPSTTAPPTGQSCPGASTSRP